MPLTEHEPRDQLPPEVVEQRRALESLIEELEAVAWYNERAAASDEPDLSAILIHNRDEEIEHAMMALEWLRRRMPAFDENMRTYLFTSGEITALEDAAEGGDDGGKSASAATGDGSLNIGSMRNTGA
ncbi:MAG: ferritin [Phycisphaerae bacterium]|nr:ferritin [Phycisphaerae bacterium]